jgi:predicted SAM-dependent methyltransferase
MHASAFAHMALCVERYMKKDRKYRILDFGSGRSEGQRQTHRDLLVGYDCEITGVDIRYRENVDVVMHRPYRVPMKSNSVDIIFAGQVFEHVAFFWVSFMELARVLQPGGYIFMTVPSRGHVHSFDDCWRYYPDGMRALAAFAHLKLKEVHTDFPPSEKGRHAYAMIDKQNYYWGDTVGVFQKPKRYRLSTVLKILLVREVNVRWANAIKDLSPWPMPPKVKARNNILGTASPAAPTPAAEPSSSPINQPTIRT